MYQQDSNPIISWCHGPKPFSLRKEKGEWNIYVLTSVSFPNNEAKGFKEVLYASYNSGEMALLALDGLIRRRGF